MLTNKLSLPDIDKALPGREQPVELDNRHFVLDRPIKEPFEEAGGSLQKIVFGMGCFWGAERKFWTIPGVYTTAVGYAAGLTPNPTYEEVCTGLTGHNEVVLVVYDADQIKLETLLRTFFESHDPTQGMRQGNDRGTQYRSGIYYFDATQKDAAEQALNTYAQALAEQGHPNITTEVIAAPEFYYAEQYHQQYLAKNPNGYCGLGGTGVSCHI
ncbi:MAG: peptide-methionine (S)-S-oxide reductase MsrA [bacterium]